MLDTLLQNLDVETLVAAAVGGLVVVLLKVGSDLAKKLVKTVAKTETELDDVALMAAVEALAKRGVLGSEIVDEIKATLDAPKDAA